MKKIFSWMQRNRRVASTVLAVAVVAMIFALASGNFASSQESKGAAGAGKPADTTKAQSAAPQKALSENVDLGEFQGVDLARELNKAEQTEGALKRGSIDVGKSSIKYYSAQSGAAVTGQAIPEKGDMAIVDFGPTGELPVETQKPSIYVMFTHPVVPLAKLGEPMTESNIMKIEPKVAGTYRWYGTRVLSFEPDKSLIDLPLYTVTINSATSSLGGKKLGKPFSFYFYTETVKVVNYYPGNSTDTDGSLVEVPVNVAQYAILEFNQPIDENHISRFITVEVGATKAAFSVSRPEYPARLASRTSRALLLTLNDVPPENAKIKITLASGASPQKNYPTRKNAQELKYETVTPFQITGIMVYSYGFPRNNLQDMVPVYLEFSHPVDKAITNSNWAVSVNSASRAIGKIEIFESVIRLGISNLNAGDLVKVYPPADIKDIFGRQLRNSSEKNYVVIPAASPFIELPDLLGYQLEAAFKPKFIWSARNMFSIRRGIKAGDFQKWHLSAGSGLPGLNQINMASWKANRVHYEVEDLGKYLNKDGYGTAIIAFESDRYKPGPKDPSPPEKESFAIQVTDIGITTRFAYNRVLVWAHSLSTGAALVNADVTIGTEKLARTGKTDASGLAVFALAKNEIEIVNDSKGKSDSYFRRFDMAVSVKKGTDRADLLASNTVDIYQADLASHRNPEEIVKSYDRTMLFTDRGLYKAGEEIALRGIHWIQTLSELTPYVGEYTLEIQDSRNREVLWSTKGTTTASGGLAHKFDLPKKMEPGEYSIRYSVRRSNNGEDFGNLNYSVAGGIKYSEYVDYQTFTVAQFRGLTFQVNTSVPERQFFADDEISTDLSASRLAGGAMAGAAYSYYWVRRPTGFSPPGTEWKAYVFGPGNWEGYKTLSSGKGVLAPSGNASIKESTAGQIASGGPYNYVMEATVEDIDRQAISSSATVLVHPASFYIGARLASGSSDGWWSRFVSTNKDVKAEGVLVDPSGKAWTSDAAVKVQIIYDTWKYIQQQGAYGRINTRWENVEEVITIESILAKNGKFNWTFKVKDSGNYLLSFETTDTKGRLTKSALRFYATGSSWVRNATESPSEIDMIVDREEYNPGEVARILVNSPVPEADYLLTIEREGIVSHKIVHLSSKNNMLEIPITEAHVPIIYVVLTSFTSRKEAPKDYFEPDLGKPRSLFGLAGIKVSTHPVTLDITVTAAKPSYQPGDMAEVTVKVTHKGKPVSDSEVTLMGVDRAVLDLINYHVPNPIEYFYAPYHFPLGVQGDDSRRLLLKPVTYNTDSLTGGAGDSADATKPKERKDFRPLALFEPFARTNKDGIAKISFKLPDSLTTYRLTAVALKDAKLGLSEGELYVRNPINVRAALPRRFRNRDTAVAGVVMNNLTNVAQTVQVTAESSILGVSGERSRKVTLSPMGVYELPFVLTATTPGEGTISFTIKGDVINEKLVNKVIVERPLVKEAFTTIGKIEAKETTANEGIVIPSAITPGYGSLSISTYSTLRAFMEPSLQRLRQPLEPWTSDYRRLFYAFGFAFENENMAYAQSALENFKAKQLLDGGIYLGSWDFDPFLPEPEISILLAHFYVFADQGAIAKFKGPDRQKLLGYLESLKGAKQDLDPFYKAYLAYVLAASKHYDAKFLKTVEDLGDSLGLGGYGLLAQAYLAGGDKASATRVFNRSKNFIQMGTQRIEVKQTYEASSYWISLKAEMALMLKNALDLGMDSGFIQRLANSFADDSRYWSNFMDDLWVMIAFDALLDKEGGGAGNTSVDVKMGTTNLMSAMLSPSKPQADSTLEFFGEPLVNAKRDTIFNLGFQKNGPNPVYYTTIMRYALPTETAYARDEGLGVTTIYETLDGQKISEKALVLGETYRVRVNVTSSKRAKHLELLVPIPSGMEIVDPGFVTTGHFRNAGGTDSETINRETVYGDTIDVVAEGTMGFDEDGWYIHFYYPDSFALDNMMVYRWTDFYAGRREVTFLARVTTPGIYPTPPTSAQLEFEPEVFGRTEGKIFVIKP